MYEEFFGLTEKPFSIQPDPSFLYWGRGHRLAYAMLEYGVLNHAGISVVTGEIGCGKTTLIHRLLDQLSDTHSVALLSNIQAGRGDLLSWVLMGFGQPFAGKTHVELFAQLQDFFISEYARGRRVVLIIDEAQNLSIDMLEELRMLSNINAGKDQLLQLILVGQPELKGVLNRPEMLQLAQRIGSDFHLTPLSRQEVDAYIETRLMIAGATQRIFSEAAVSLIAEQSRGVPRVINIIADTALVYAFSAQSELVDTDIVRDVVRDKTDYGVFGLAAEKDLPVPPGSDAGPAAFIPDDEPARRRPALREVKSEPPAPREGDDAPRMPPAPRRRQSPSPSQSQSAAAAAPRREPVDEARQTRPAARPRVETMPSPRRAPAPVLAEVRAPAPGREEAPAAPSLYAPDPDPEPAPAPPRPAAAPAPGRLGVVVIGAGGPPEATIASIGEGLPIAFVVQDTDIKAVEAARRAGAEIVEIADRALSPGRARNAGYRRLKKDHPDLAYVQFVEAGFRLDSGWLAAAARFMERRPEVAALEGSVSKKHRAGSSAADAAAAGEIRVTGQTILVRTDAFEAAGGFRGDLAINETQDLCIRFRRRGGHVWRIEEPMGGRVGGRRGVGGWWSRAYQAGFEYAHGASLHGGPPEHLYMREKRRALIWGALLPFVIVFGAVSVGAAAYSTPLFAAWPVAVLAVLAAGLGLYLLRIVYDAVRGGPFSQGAWARATLSTLGRVPEALGVWRYHLGGARRGLRRIPA